MILFFFIHYHHHTYANKAPLLRPIKTVPVEWVILCDRKTVGKQYAQNWSTISINTTYKQAMPVCQLLGLRCATPTITGKNWPLGQFFAYWKIVDQFPVWIACVISRAKNFFDESIGWNLINSIFSPTLNCYYMMMCWGCFGIPNKYTKHHETRWNVYVNVTNNESFSH